jgi:hypothetical protein
MKYKKIHIYKDLTNNWNYTIEKLPGDRVETDTKPNVSPNRFYYPENIEDEEAFYELKYAIARAMREEIVRINKELISLHRFHFLK